MQVLASHGRSQTLRRTRGKGEEAYRRVSTYLCQMAFGFSPSTSWPTPSKAALSIRFEPSTSVVRRPFFFVRLDQGMATGLATCRIRCQRRPRLPRHQRRTNHIGNPIQGFDQVEYRSVEKSQPDENPPNWPRVALRARISTFIRCSRVGGS